MKSVRVGFDGSDESRDALQLAKQFATVEGATLHVAFVQWNDANEEEFFDEIFAKAKKELGSQEFVEHPLREVSAAKALTDLAEESDPDLLVLGSCHRRCRGPSHVRKRRRAPPHRCTLRGDGGTARLCGQGPLRLWTDWGWLRRHRGVQARTRDRGSARPGSRWHSSAPDRGSTCPAQSCANHWHGCSLRPSPSRGRGEVAQGRSGHRSR